jgi:hypothetical protein
MAIHNLFGGGDFLKLTVIGWPAHPLRLGDVVSDSIISAEPPPQFEGAPQCSVVMGHGEHRPQSAGRDSGGITIAGHSRLIGSSSLFAVWDAGMDFGAWLRGAAGLAIADNAANHALLIQPNSVLALRARAFALRAQGKWQEAEAVLHRMICSRLRPIATGNSARS